MAATDMTKAGLEPGALVRVRRPSDIRALLSDREEQRLRTMADEGDWFVLECDPQSAEVRVNRAGRTETVHVEDVERNYDDAQQARQARFARLLEHYPGDGGVPEETDTIERFVLVQELEVDRFKHAFNWGDTFDAAVELAGGEVLEGWLPEAVFDLDTGKRIEVHVSSPVITRSEDQDVTVNVLSDQDLAEQAAYRARIEQAFEDNWRGSAKNKFGEERVEGWLMKHTETRAGTKIMIYSIDASGGDDPAPIGTHIIERDTVIVTDDRFRHVPSDDPGVTNLPPGQEG